MKMCSSFTHPNVVPNLYECLSSVKHKRRYFEECSIKQLMVPIVFHIMDVNGYVNCLVTKILQNIPFLIIQVWNNIRVSK